MKKIVFLVTVTLSFYHYSAAQEMQPKERAAFIAKEDFSKSKYKKVEKYGITKELRKTIISSPVVKQNIKEYSGVYRGTGPDYILTLNINDENNLNGTLKEANSNNTYKAFTLKSIIIKDALFKAVKINSDGTETPLEGVFIDKNDNGVVDFGLGLKLANTILINGSIHTDKLFMKKVG